MRYFVPSCVIVWLVVSVPCTGEPAHFWLSASNTAPEGPEASSLDIEEGSSGEIYIWGRPAPAKKLKNLSLNLIALQPGIDFDDGTITVHNAVSGPVQRFEYVSDASSMPALQSSKTMPQVAVGDADSIEGLQGFTLGSNPNFRGIGPTCVGGETGCFIAGDGKPAWLIASVSYSAIVGGPATELYLQIGEHGINHESVAPGDYDFNGVVDALDYDTWKANFGSNTGLWADGNGNGTVDAADYTSWRDSLGGTGVVETTALTEVRFGIDTLDGMPEPIHNAAADREITLAGDDPDAVINIVAAGSGVTAPAAGVPEPPSLLLFVAGALILAVHRYAPRQSNCY